MNSVKTSISLPEDLFERVERMAEEMDISRSRVFSIAVRELLDKWDNERLKKQLNDVYGDNMSSDDKGLLEGMKTKYRELDFSEWK